MILRKETIKDELESYNISGFSRYNKDLSLFIKNSGEILFKNNIIGFITDKESEGIYRQFVVLTMQKSLTDNEHNRMIDILSECANDIGMYVVFVPMIDIGFGIKKWSLIYDKNIIITNLIKVAKFSKEDVKTAAAIITNSNTIKGNITDEDFIYSYNQRVNDEVVHAEKVLQYFVRENWPSVIFSEWISLIEPCYDCLKGMIELGATNIGFLTLHKKKWNTEQYLDLVDNVRVGKIKNEVIISKKKAKISYNKINNEKVNKFYRRMKYDSLS